MIFIAVIFKTNMEFHVIDPRILEVVRYLKLFLEVIKTLYILIVFLPLQNGAKWNAWRNPSISEITRTMRKESLVVTPFCFDIFMICQISMFEFLKFICIYFWDKIFTFIKQHYFKNHTNNVPASNIGFDNEIWNIKYSCLCKKSHAFYISLKYM